MNEELRALPNGGLGPEPKTQNPEPKTSAFRLAPSVYRLDMQWPITYTRKVRFSDTDAQGIVFNGNYLTYFDDTLTDYFDALGIPWAGFVERGYEMVLGRVEIDFRSSAKVGDVIVTGARCTGIGNTSVLFDLQTWNQETGRVIVEGQEIQVVVDATTFKKKPVPDFFVEAVAALQGSPVPR